MRVDLTISGIAEDKYDEILEDIIMAIKGAHNVKVDIGVGHMDEEDCGDENNL